MEVVLRELRHVMQKKITVKGSQGKVYLQRYRDLMIGIVLNVTCNIESPNVTTYLLKLDTISSLGQILID